MSAAPPSMETDEYFIFPRERPGLDYDLNWSLNKNGVTPSGDAHRITKKADLKKLGLTAGGKVKAEGTVDEAGEGALSFPEIDAALESVKAALGSSPTLYVAEGDCPGTRIPCRIITDSAAVAAAGVLEQMPKRKPAPLPITCFVSEGGADFKGFVVEQGDGVIYSEDDNVVSMVLTGKSASPGTLAAGIAAAATAYLE